MRANGRRITKITFRAAEFRCLACGRSGCFPGATVKAMQGTACPHCGSSAVRWGRAKVKV